MLILQTIVEPRKEGEPKTGFKKTSVIYVLGGERSEGSTGGLAPGVALYKNEHARVEWIRERNAEVDIARRSTLYFVIRVDEPESDEGEDV